MSVLIALASVVVWYLFVMSYCFVRNISHGMNAIGVLYANVFLAPFSILRTTAMWALPFLFHLVMLAVPTLLYVLFWA